MENVQMQAVLVSKKVVDGKTPFKWMITLTLWGKEFNTEYTMGAAHVSKRGKNVNYQELQSALRGRSSMFGIEPSRPDLKDVLLCLATDCRTLDSSPLWPDYADDFGMNVDSIRDKSVYDKVCEQYIQLRKFFAGNFQEFLALEE